MKFDISAFGGNPVGKKNFDKFISPNNVGKLVIIAQNEDEAIELGKLWEELQKRLVVEK